MLCEYSDCPLGFAGNVKRPFELHDGPVHQFDSQLTGRIVEPRPNLLQHIVHGASKVRRQIGRPLGFKLPR
jgi:hypothetical protein